jgi:hypothetical protein
MRLLWSRAPIMAAGFTLQNPDLPLFVKELLFEQSIQGEHGKPWLNRI